MVEQPARARAGVERTTRGRSLRLSCSRTRAAQPLRPGSQSSWVDEGVRHERQAQRGGTVPPVLGPDLLAAVPLRTLDADSRDFPVEPPEDRVPEPEPPGLLRRWADALGARLRPRR